MTEIQKIMDGIKERYRRSQMDLLLKDVIAGVEEIPEVEKVLYEVCWTDSPGPTGWQTDDDLRRTRLSPELCADCYREFKNRLEEYRGKS